MNKLGKEAIKNAQRLSLRVLSFVNIGVNKVVNPVAKSTLEYITKSSKDKIKDPSADKAENFPSYNYILKPFETVGEWIDSSQIELEKKLKEQHGVDPNDWVLSKNNFELLLKLSDSAGKCFKEIRDEPYYRLIKNTNILSALQKIYYASLNAQEKGDTIDPDEEILSLQRKMFENVKFATATFGDMMNYIYSGKDYTKILKLTDYDKEFVSHTGIEASDLLYSNWNATPYWPAYCIALDRKNKNLVVCLRGTNCNADVLTDLDSEYLKVELRKMKNQKHYLKFDYALDKESEVKKDINQTTLYLHETENQIATDDNDEIIAKGFTHEGIMKASINLFKDIRDRVEKIFSDPNLKDFDLRIVGHSLGGGLTTLVTMLFLIHPPKCFEGNIREKIFGFSYGGASVFTADFDEFLQSHLVTVVCGPDVIPRLSYNAMQDLLNILLQVKKLDMESSAFNEILEVSRRIDPDDSRTKEFAKLYSEMKTKVKNDQRLLPSGRVIWLQELRKPNAENLIKFVDVEDKMLFSEITLMNGMFRYHFPHVYEEMIGNINIVYKPKKNLVL